MPIKYAWRPKTQRIEDDLRDWDEQLFQWRLQQSRFEEEGKLWPEERAYPKMMGAYEGAWKGTERELPWLPVEAEEKWRKSPTEAERQFKEWMPWLALGAVAPLAPSGPTAFAAASRIPWAAARIPTKAVLGAIYPEVPLRAGARYLYGGGKAGVGKFIELAEKTITRPLASEEQKTVLMNLLKEKKFITEAGKYMPSVRNLLIPLTKQYGTKRSTQNILKNLTDDQAATMIEMLGKIEAGARIPKNVALMPTELMNLIPSFKEVSILDKVRQVPYVLRKIGLWRLWEDFIEMDKKRIQDIIGFRKLSGYWDDLLHKAHPRDYKASKERVFNALENPIETHRLDPQEQEVFQFLKAFFDDWADKLGIPMARRTKNYITHIFDETHKRIYRQHNAIDPDLLAAMDFIKPKTVSMPFLRERGGVMAGLLKEPFQVAEIYNSYAARKYYWQPILTKLRAYMDYTPPLTQKYLRAFANRLAGRPTPLDAEANQFLKEFAGTVSKFVPKSIGNRLVLAAQTRNIAALAAHNYTGILYMSWLGLRPVSAIRNLSQNILTVAEVGPIDFARGLKIMLTPEARKAREQSYIELTRRFSYLPGHEQAALGRWPEKIQKIFLAMFRGADKFNVMNAFNAGYAQAKRLGLPEPWAIRRGDEVAHSAQYLYSRIARSMLEETAAGRFLTPLTSWPRNFMELFTGWIQGRQSMVLKSYMEQTGKVLKVPEKSRKQLLTYMALVSGAFAVQGATAIRATEYTGWMSFRTLASLLSGDVPGLEWLGGIANLVGGAFTADTRMIKQGWNEIRPDRFITIIRQLERVAQGEADWLSLFIYLQQQEIEEGEEGQFKRPEMEFERPKFERPKQGFKRR